METKFQLPAITTQYPVCPIPYRIDTYWGCKANCVYCFSQDFIRRNRRYRPEEQQSQSYLIANDPDKFAQWCKATTEADYNYKRGQEVAFKERVPMKIGGVSDPFPPIESKKRVTYKMLQTLDEYDYPCALQTKFPNVLAKYHQDFNNPNWIIDVTLISLDENFVKIVEPGAPSPKLRLKAIERLAAAGKKVLCRIQPVIYPKIMKDMDKLVKAFKDHGAWAFNTESLKMRVLMTEEEKVKFRKLEPWLEADIESFRAKENITGSDYEVYPEKTLEYSRLAHEFSYKHNIKYFRADNRFTNTSRFGDGCECCGTEVLRDYKIWGMNKRTHMWGHVKHESKHMEDVVINTFSYSTDKKRYKTLGEVMKKVLYPKQTSLLRQRKGQII